MGYQCVFDGGGVCGVAGYDCGGGEHGRGDQGAEFGLGADEDDDGVAVGEEGGEEAGPEIAGGAEEEDFHFDVCE